jgi:hypothetical protein
MIQCYPYSEDDSMLILKSEMTCFKLGVLGCDAIGWVSMCFGSS